LSRARSESARLIERVPALVRIALVGVALVGVTV